MIRTHPLFLIILLTATIGCARPPRIRLVLPAGYRGVVRALEDSSVAPKDRRDGDFVYHVPKDGTLRVDSFEPFRRSHVAIAEYDNGIRIPYSYEIEDTAFTNQRQSKGDQVSIRGMGITGGGGKPPELRWFIGTEEEYNLWQSAQN